MTQQFLKKGVQHKLIDNEVKWRSKTVSNLLIEKANFNSKYREYCHEKEEKNCKS